MLCFHFNSEIKYIELKKDDCLIQKIIEIFQKSFQGVEYFKFKLPEGRANDFLELFNGNFLILNPIFSQIEIYSFNFELIHIKPLQMLHFNSTCFEYKDNNVMIGCSKVELLDTISMKFNTLDVGHSDIIDIVVLTNDRYASSSTYENIIIWNLKGEVFYTFSHQSHLNRIV